MTQEELSRLAMAKVAEIKALNPDLKDMLIALHDDKGTMAYADGKDVDEMAETFLLLASAVAVPFVKHYDKEHAVKVDEHPKDPANKITYLFLVFLTGVVGKAAGIDWNTHVRMAMDADGMGLK